MLVYKIAQFSLIPKEFLYKITLGKTRIHSKNFIIEKDLTKVIRERTGAKYSGLTAWPVNKRQFRKGRSLILTNKWFRYPMALQIRQQKPIPKTIVIERGKIKVDDKLNKLDDYPSVKGKPIIKPITVEFPKNRKPYKSDPLTSFFQQMDEINEKD